MMTERSKQIIEGFRFCVKFEESCEKCPIFNLCVGKGALTTHLSKAALEVIDELQAQQPKWTPVTEGLPEPCVAVLVMYKQENDTPHRHMAYLNRRGKWVGLAFEGEVTAWHPLPKPYSGEA